MTHGFARFRMRFLMPFLSLIMLLLMYSFGTFMPLYGWLRLVRFLLHLEAGRRATLHTSLVGHIAYSITTLPPCCLVKCPAGWKNTHDCYVFVFV